MASSSLSLAQKPQSKSHLPSFGHITAEMEAQFGFPVNQETKCQSDFEPVLASTDLGYYSASSSLSPTSSVDSSCFSPPVCQYPVVFGQPREPEWTGQAWENPTPAFPAQNRRRTRSKNPGKKRQSASEREKLRMRDLTKALHHLRTFLPPSVAPAGQTLTKIDTLRLTIRYISYLSSQLAPKEPSNARNIQSHSATSNFQQGGFSDVCSQSAAHEDPQHRDQLYQGTVAYAPLTQQMETSSNFSTYYRDTQIPPIHFHMGQTYTH